MEQSTGETATQSPLQPVQQADNDKVQFNIRIMAQVI